MVWLELRRNGVGHDVGDALLACALWLSSASRHHRCRLRSLTFGHWGAPPQRPALASRMHRLDLEGATDAAREDRGDPERADPARLRRGSGVRPRHREDRIRDDQARYGELPP